MGILVANLHPVALSARSSGVLMSTLAPTTLRELEQSTRVYRSNVLIIGDVSRSEREEVLDTVKRHRRLDLFRAQRPAFDLPSHPAVILVLDDACELSRGHQLRLLEWVSRHRVQIVSFASHSLYDMVCADTFIDRLYYHLNTICVIAGDLDSASRQPAQGT